MLWNNTTVSGISETSDDLTFSRGALSWSLQNGTEFSAIHLLYCPRSPPIGLTLNDSCSNMTNLHVIPSYYSVSRLLTCLEQNGWINVLSWLKLNFGSFYKCRSVLIFASILHVFHLKHEKNESLCICVSRNRGLAVCHAFLWPSAWSFLHLLSIATLFTGLLPSV